MAAPTSSSLRNLSGPLVHVLRVLLKSDPYLHDKLLKSARPDACKREIDDRRSGVLPQRRRRTAAADERIFIRIRSRRLLLRRRNRRLQGCIACQPQRAQSGGLFKRGRTRCLVFGHCLLPLSLLLFLFPESRFGAVAHTFSVGLQSRYSCSSESARRTDLPA